MGTNKRKDVGNHGYITCIYDNFYWDSTYPNYLVRTGTVFMVQRQRLTERKREFEERAFNLDDAIQYLRQCICK
jgi:5-methylcytosine-specific restriction endonuclease McrBC regulatory subunit McrC